MRPSGTRIRRSWSGSGRSGSGGDSSPTGCSGRTRRSRRPGARRSARRSWAATSSGPPRARWPADGWRGWWGEDPPFHTPCFVLTHYEREPIVVGDTTFHFVSGTPAEVLGQAQKAAGDLDIRLGGGPTTVNEFLQADLVDYLHVVLVPIVLGRGVRLWDGLDGLHERYTLETVTVPSGATHLFFTR